MNNSPYAYWQPTCHNFILFLKMTNGGEKALPNGQMLEKLSLCFGDIINLGFQLIWDIMIYDCLKSVNNKLTLLVHVVSKDFVTGTTGLVMESVCLKTFQ
jgi:hypothetical protein